MSKDYYKILDISRNASEEEIKKAYRTKAKEFHPDLNRDNQKESEEKFKEIQEAYDILSDVLKRNQYDKYGEVFNGAFPSGQRAGNNIVFNFGSFNFRKTYEKRIAPINLDVSLTISEIFNGVKKDLFCLSDEQCSECSGTGSAPNGSVKKCEACHGSGETTINGLSFTSNVCTLCGGKGEIIGSPCRKCHGKKIEKMKKNLAIEIPKGVSQGTVLTIQGAGNYCCFNKKRGDVNIRINVIKDSLFEIFGNNLVCVFFLRMDEAIFGCSKIIPSPHGKISVDMPKNIQTNSSLKIQGKGMRKNINSEQFGDLILQIVVETPSISDEDRKKMQEIKMDYRMVTEFEEKISKISY